MTQDWDSVVLNLAPSFQTKGDLLSKSGMVFAVIADENTCVGFLLAGVGYAWSDGLRNVFVVEKTTEDEELEACFRKFASRANVAIIVITNDVAERLDRCVASHEPLIPVVLIIPSPYHPFEDDDRNSYDSSNRFPSEASSRTNRSDGGASM